MTQSYTVTESWSRTHARKVGGKVVADLRQMQQEYGLPTEQWLEKYLSELVVLLGESVLKEVTYGFRRNDAWIVALRYTADMNGNLIVDDRSGRVPRGVNVIGATWYSYLLKNSKWDGLSDAAKAAIEQELPFQREGAAEPSVGGVIQVGDKTYSSAGSGVKRSTIGGAL
jgi:hypothetical protein